MENNEPHSLQFILSAEKVVSVNEMYKARVVYTKSGRPVATIYKTARAKQTEDFLKQQVRALDIEKNATWITPDTCFDVCITIIMKTKFRLARVDTQNLDKQIFDAIFRGLGVVDDSRVISLQMTKTICEDLKDEKILVRLSETQRPAHFDYIPRPNIVWCEEPLDKLKPIPKRGLKKDQLYFAVDPGVADTKVFILDPKKGINYNTTMKIAEETVLPTLYSRGFVYIAIIHPLDPDDKWTIEEWSDLMEFKALMEQRGKEYSGIKVRETLSRDDIYTWLQEDRE
jgi:Holliday junction resolvase RusA-like endonuclease